MPVPTDPVPDACMNETDASLLVYGFVRRNWKNNMIPKEIIEFILNKYFMEGVSYKEALYALLNNPCCIGAYDYKDNRWRSAIYIAHWDDTRRIMLRFMDDTDCSIIIENKSMANYCCIKEFPTNAIDINPKKFKTTYNILEKISNLSTEDLNRFLKEQRLKSLKYV